MVDGKLDPLSYLVGMVSSEDSKAAMQGHHIAKTGDGIPRTLFVCDEASSIKDHYYTMARTWANRIFVFGNPWPCENFFRKASDDGDLLSDEGDRYWRKVIKVSAEDSPNVRYARAEIAAGKKPSDSIIVPGVKPWHEYVKDMRLLDEVEKCVSLGGEFYRGAEILLYPRDWLERAYGISSKTPYKRQALAIGIDPAEGGDRTAMAAVDDWGLIELVSKKTPDTTAIVDEAKAFIVKHQCAAECVAFDRGGGGKEHADRLRQEGFGVTTIAFGESIQADVTRQRLVYRPFKERLDNREDRYAYVNRRAEMYGELSRLLDPSLNSLGFALIPPINGEQYTRLRQQMAVIPKVWDQEGRMRLPSKHRKPGQVGDKGERTLTELIGHSPDELDALVLACHRMLNPARLASIAGAAS